MSEKSSNCTRSLVVEHDQPLVGLIIEEDGQEVTRYFAGDSQADEALSESDTRAAFAAIGSFSDLDWDEMISALGRIRHESQPTPPIDL